MKAKAILFDLDDTLLWDERSVEEAFEATCFTAMKKAGVDAAKLEEAVRSEARSLYESYETFPFTQLIGINPFEGLWANFTSDHLDGFRKLRALAPQYRKDAWTRGLKKLGVDDAALGEELAEQFPRERRSRPIAYDETYAVLDALKERGYALLMLTNGAPDLQTEKLAGSPQLVPYFDHIVISGDLGEGKPAVSIFRHAMDLLGISAEEGLMVGDKLTTDILGSSRVGMANAWVNRRGIVRSDEIVPTYEIQSLTELLDLLED